MKKFEILEYPTADTGFIAYGKDLNELFENAAIATYSIMVNLDKVEPKIKKEINIEAIDLYQLMFKWINELLYFLDTEILVFSKFKVRIEEKDGKYFLHAEVFGEKVDKNKHELGTLVKACSYHNMEIKKEDDMWKAKVIVDI
ncbi:MAG: archease [Candidatus Aenigmatarchaeota archaeon]